MQDQRIPLGYCQCGCGQKTTIAKRTNTRDDTVRGRPNKFVNSGHAVATTMELYKPDELGCWVWQRPLNHGGYGGLFCPRTRRCRMAHRVIYEQHMGFPIPDGKHLHHLCGNKACVNPEHLEVVSNAEHGAAPELRAIRKLLAAGVDVTVIASAFQTTSARVRLIGGLSTATQIRTP